MAKAQGTLRLKPEALEDLPVIERFIGYNLKRAYIIMQTDFRRALGEDGLGPRVFSALSLVVQFPNVTQSELARMLGIERSGLVAIVDELEERGFLKRSAVAGDRRVQALTSTDEGKAVFEEAFASVSAHEDKLLEDFSSEEREMLVKLLQKIRLREE
jgi:DNA-binding MarR family transcriptional regulator